jgi:hypothetical protein
MTKKDLMNGMIVELRNGTRYLYCEGVIRGLNAWNLISNYTDNLKIPEFPRLDIVKVYKDTKKYNLSTIFEYQYLELIWQRPEPIKLSKRENEVLKALDVLDYKYIARDKSGNIFAYLPKPIKDRAGVWFFNDSVHPDEMELTKLKRDLFSFVEWKDREPTNILNLLSVLNEGERK